MTDLEKTEMPSVEPRRGIHYLKSHPRFFAKVIDGTKQFEIRFDDRGFRIGDGIVLLEWDPEQGQERVAEGYTGGQVSGTIVYVLSSKEMAGGGLESGYVALGIEWRHL
jgi:hypothetical protein